ncbi:MAG TPA: ferredoxin--NADP reductase [Acidimicrobiales bacterium]|nr:ferredoxin--NADP reductase [Acidimicrobiales bacterium]
MARSEPVLSAARTARDHGFHQLRVARVVRETADACSLVLEVPEELLESFDYHAGQFCNLRVWVGDQDHVRCYSMSSAPAIDDELTVTVKRVPGGVVSNWINDRLAPGDLVDVARPAGFFQLTDTSGDLVAFAAGSGITPVFSLVKTALATTNRSVRLHYANRDRANVIFDDELCALEQRAGERLRVVCSYDTEHGLLGPETVSAFVGDGSVRTAEFYICGPGAYMEIVEQTLVAMGADASRVHIERFTPAELLVGAPPPPPEAPGGTLVTVELDGRTATTDHRPGTTILQTARQMGLSPPFSCESGSCATCMAKLVEGAVSMFVNNALTEDEVAEGWVLTCQSVPTTSSVHVVYGFEE